MQAHPEVCVSALINFIAINIVNVYFYVFIAAIALTVAAFTNAQLAVETEDDIHSHGELSPSNVSRLCLIVQMA